MQQRRHAHGFALLVVLWFLVLLAAIGTYIMGNARSEMALARNIVAAAHAESLADAGIAEAVVNLGDPAANRRWPLDGASHRLALPGGSVVIRAEDESLKINPNLAADALLAGLFQAVGVDGLEARHLGAAMADWVSKDGPARPFGAKLSEYRAAGKSYGPPNAPVESLDELRLVLDMTPQLFAAVRPYLSIYTQSDAPDPNVAPPVIRRALAIAAEISASDTGQDQTTGDMSDAAAATAAPTPVAVQSPAPPAPAGAAPTSAASSNTDILADVEVTARSDDGGVFVRRAILHITGDGPNGFVVLDWGRAALND